jgi:hypothetical protein
MTIKSPNDITKPYLREQKCEIRLSTGNPTLKNHKKAKRLTRDLSEKK